MCLSINVSGTSLFLPLSPNRYASTRPRGRGALTGHSVDGAERPEHTHSADGGEADVVAVQRVFHHPVKRAAREHSSVLVA